MCRKSRTFRTSSSESRQGNQQTRTTPWVPDEVHTIHVYSQQRGYRETQLIIAEIVTALHKQNLTVTGRPTALAWYTGSNVFMDRDGVTRHGIVRIRILTLE